MWSQGGDVIVLGRAEGREPSKGLAEAWEAYVGTLHGWSINVDGTSQYENILQ